MCSASPDARESLLLFIRGNISLVGLISRKSMIFQLLWLTSRDRILLWKLNIVVKRLFLWLLLAFFLIFFPFWFWPILFISPEGNFDFSLNFDILGLKQQLIAWSYVRPRRVELSQPSRTFDAWYRHVWPCLGQAARCLKWSPIPYRRRGELITGGDQWLQTPWLWPISPSRPRVAVIFGRS